MLGETIVYSETQRFTQWWLWFLFSAILTGMVFQGFLDANFTITDLEEIKAFLPAVLWLVIMLSFYSIKLKTVFSDKAIYFRFFPFHRKFRKIEIEDIQTLKIIKYKPIGDYLGWGIRYSFTNGALAYTTSGDIGLEIKLKSNKLYLIGIQNPENLRLALKTSGIYNTLFDI